MRQTNVQLMFAALFVLACGPDAQARDPRPNITKGEAINSFVDAVNLACIYSKVSGTPIDALPPGVEDDLVPADPQDRKLTLAPKDKPLMVSKTLGNILQVYIDKGGDCVATVVQLPVQKTLDILAQLLRQLGKGTYQEAPYKPGYNPVGYEFVRKFDTGGELTVHMEGAEPGLPQHALRYSLIMVRVTRKP